MDFIKATRQSWKFYLSFVGLGIFFFFRFFGDVFVDKGILKKDTLMDLTIYSLVLLFLICIFLCLAVRCPKCHMNILWHGMSKVRLKKFGNWIDTVPKCPRCGYKPVKRK